MPPSGQKFTMSSRVNYTSCPPPGTRTLPKLFPSELSKFFPSVLVPIIMIYILQDEDEVDDEVYVDETNIWMHNLYILRTSTKMAKWTLTYKVPDSDRFTQNRKCLFCGNRLGEIKFALCGYCREQPYRMSLFVVIDCTIRPKCPVSGCYERPLTLDALCCRNHLPKNTPVPKSDEKESKHISVVIARVNEMLHTVAKNRYDSKTFFDSAMKIPKSKDRVFCYMKGCRNRLSPRSKISICKNCVSRFTVHMYKNKNYENLPLIKTIPQKTSEQAKHLFPEIDERTHSIVFRCMNNGCYYGTTSISDSICSRCATS